MWLSSWRGWGPAFSTFREHLCSVCVMSGSQSYCFYIVRLPIFFLCLLKRSMTNWRVLAPLAMGGNMWILVLPYGHKRGCVLKCRTGIELSRLPPNWNVYNLAVTFSLLTHFFSLKFCFVSYWCSYSWIFLYFLVGICLVLASPSFYSPLFCVFTF